VDNVTKCGIIVWFRIYCLAGYFQNRNFLEVIKSEFQRFLISKSVYFKLQVNLEYTEIRTMKHTCVLAKKLTEGIPNPAHCSTSYKLPMDEGLMSGSIAVQHKLLHGFPTRG